MVRSMKEEGMIIFQLFILIVSSLVIQTDEEVNYILSHSRQCFNPEIYSIIEETLFPVLRTVKETKLYRAKAILIMADLLTSSIPICDALDRMYIEIINSVDDMYLLRMITARTKMGMPSRECLLIDNPAMNGPSQVLSIRENSCFTRLKTNRHIILIKKIFP